MLGICDRMPRGFFWLKRQIEEGIDHGGEAEEGDDWGAGGGDVSGGRGAGNRAAAPCRLPQPFFLTNPNKADRDPGLHRNV